MRHLCRASFGSLILASALVGVPSTLSAALLSNNGVFSGGNQGEVTPGGLSPFVQWDRGTANSLNTQWNVFTGLTNQSPDVGVFPADGSGLLAGGLDGTDATVSELTGGAFVTGGGNIYSFAIPTDFQVNVPNYGLGTSWNTRVVLQFRIQGSGIDFGSVADKSSYPAYAGYAPFRLLYVDASSNTQELLWQDRVAHEVLSVTPLGGFGGNLVDQLLIFDVPGFNPASFTLEFNASSSSMSFDALAIDTFTTQAALAPVPEPAAISLAACAVAVAVFARRRWVVWRCQA